MLLLHLDVDAIDATLFPPANVANRTGVEFGQMIEAIGCFWGVASVEGYIWRK